jgi:hypothetical protein
MKISEFLAQLNISSKDWGLWLNYDNVQEYHVGQYFYENDRLPKHYIHVASLHDLAHRRQQYILNNNASGKSDAQLGQEWADHFLSEWNVSTVSLLHH